MLVRSILLCLLVAQPAAAQLADEGVVGQLAGLLALADAERYDGPVLQEALRHSLPAVRRQAVLAAGRIGDPAAVDMLVAALEDTSDAVRSAAAFALGLLRDARAIAPLVASIRAVAPGGQTDEHLEAVTAIAKIGGVDGARALADIIAAGAEAGPGAESSTAIRALLEAWRLGARAPIPLLIRSAETGTGAVARRNGLYSLGRLRVATAGAPLFAALQDREPAIRLVAARGLTAALVDSARLDRRAVIARLRGLLLDPDPAIRINALRSLASFADSGVAAAVLPLVSDGHPGVQVQAETTLGVLGGGAAVEALASRAASGSFAVRRQALIGLSQAHATRGSEMAAALLRDSDWRWRRVAAEAFGAARDHVRLEPLLGDQDGRVVAMALEALTRVLPDTHQTLLGHARRMLAHDDPAVRSIAADALGKRPDVADVERLVAAYTRAEGDPFNDARLSAVGALAAIARSGSEGRLAVVNRFISSVPRSQDYLVRRLAAERLPEAAQVWGPAEPITTGRSDVDYREIVRRYLLPAINGSAVQVTVETDRGSLAIRLLPLEAPLTVAAFLEHVDRRFFDGHRWHRVVPNFVVQDGDPRGDGWGGPGPGWVLRDELNPVRYGTGTMGMALSGPDTGGSQFFITHSSQPHLDGTYTVFGEVTSGAAVLAAITQGDRIRSIHR